MAPAPGGNLVELPDYPATEQDDYQEKEEDEKSPAPDGYMKSHGVMLCSYPSYSMGPGTK